MQHGVPDMLTSSALSQSGTLYDRPETDAARERELQQPFWIKLRKLVTGSLNFYRVHMLYFIIVSPLLAVVLQ